MENFIEYERRDEKLFMTVAGGRVVGEPRVKGGPRNMLSRTDDIDTQKESPGIYLAGPDDTNTQNEGPGIY